MICCREPNGIPDDISQQAGKYGNYRCDTPIDLLTAMGDFINKEIKPDVIIWTGDTTPHDEWQDPTLEEKQEHIKRVTDFLKVNMTTAQIYPSLGNHDFEISNMEDFTTVDPAITYTAEIWKEWLDEDA